MERGSGSRNFAEYCTVGEAAEFLGVSTATLRNWDRSGKLKPRRHPQNGYRIYLHQDLEAVLRSADKSAPAEVAVAPLVDWSQLSDGDHIVQFYEDDEFLVEAASGFVSAALLAGDSALVVVTEAHRARLQKKLAQLGVDLAGTIESGRYVVLDAHETLSKFMVDGMPDSARFSEAAGEVMRQIAQPGRRLHAFGEMVALLWAEGNGEAAIRLEQLWNELGKEYKFSLLCAYPLSAFNRTEHATSFDGICSCHTRVLPSESYSHVSDAEERIRSVAIWQQRAQALEAEIAHRHEVEKALASRERELTDFFERAAEGLHRVGGDGTILWANQAECDLLGYARDEYIGRSIRDIHADAGAIEEILSRLGRGETLINYPARLKCKQGSIKHVLITSSANIEDGQLQYTRCITRDVTQLHAAEQALRQADRRKDEFLATLAHELRNPLAPVCNALEMLRIAPHDARTVDEARGLMERQINQMVHLVDDLMDMSRITRDKIELRKVQLDLAEVVRSALETSRPVIEARRHELVVQLPTQPVIVEADPTRLAQVFCNLFNNSAKYTEPGGRIEVLVETRQAEAAVIVKDNGAGISCEDLAYVFDMFRQVKHTLDRSGGGLGIGLTLVRRLVDLHGGSVTAASEGLGKGSQFTVRLPLAAQAASGQAAKTESAGGTRRCRVLIVDDYRDSRDTLTMLLKLKGHEVHTAGDGLEAIAEAERVRPEVILMDVGMPRLDGYDATRRIRETAWGKDIAIVALTGWSQPDDVQKSIEAGCTGHLVKPVNFAALQEMLESRDFRGNPG